MGKKKPREAPLIPADPSRCQAEKLDGSFMSFGPRDMVRCPNQAVWIATECQSIREDGALGSMSLCQPCADTFIEQLGASYATVEPIIRKAGKTSEQTQ